MRLTPNDVHDCVLNVQSELAFEFDKLKEEIMKTLSDHTTKVFLHLDSMGIDGAKTSIETAKYDIDLDATPKVWKAFLNSHFPNMRTSEFEMKEVFKRKEAIEREIKLLPTILQSALNRLKLKYVKDEKYEIYAEIIRTIGKHPFFTTIRPAVLRTEPQWKWGWLLAPERVVFADQLGAMADAFDHFDEERLIRRIEVENMATMTTNAHDTQEATS